MRYPTIGMVLPSDKKEAQQFLNIIQAIKIRYCLSSNSAALQVALKNMAFKLNKEIRLLHKMKLEEKQNGNFAKNNRRTL